MPVRKDLSFTESAELTETAANFAEVFVWFSNRLKERDPINCVELCGVFCGDQ